MREISRLQIAVEAQNSGQSGAARAQSAVARRSDRPQSRARRARGARPQRTRDGRQQRDFLPDRDAGDPSTRRRRPPPSPPARSDRAAEARRSGPSFLPPAAVSASPIRPAPRIHPSNTHRCGQHRARVVAAPAALASRASSAWWWRWPPAMRTGASIAPRSDKLLTTLGGASRQDSVLERPEEAARAGRARGLGSGARCGAPLSESADVAALIAALEAGASGAVLAAPVVDTVKRERDGTVGETVDRSGLWRALTPQVFALGELSARSRRPRARTSP